MSSKKETLARIGMAAKGVVYLLIGILTALAAFGEGGSKSGKDGILRFLAEQSYGKILLILLGIGLLGYTFYRFYQASANLKNYDDDFKGYFKRGAYFVSGLLYGFLAFSALKMAIGGSSSDSSTVSKILNSDNGDIYAFVIAIALLGKAIYEFYVAYSGKYKEEIEHTDIDSDAKSLLTKSGKMGFTARGIVLALMAYLFFKAGTGNTSGDINRTDAFSLIQQEFGSVVLGLVALGLALYGVFMLIKSKYPDTDVR